MIYSKSPPSSSSWRECCQHEEEIAILQEKLMELHNKLIDQLDVCKEQELTIIELTRKNTAHNSATAFDTFKYQSFGQHSHDSSKENQTPNYHHTHDSRDSYHAKTQLLQADLEAMRAKVLAEITEKNKLKEEVKEIRSIHKREAAAHMRKLEGLEATIDKLREDNEQLRERCERGRREQRSESQLDRLAGRLGQMEARYIKERDNNRELTQENIQLTEKLDELERELLKQRESRKDKRSFADSNSSSQSREPEQYRAPTAKLVRHSDYREEDYGRQRERQRERQKEKQRERERQREREKPEEKRSSKKRGFEQTKQLIKKLEQAEVNMRRNRKQPL